MTRLYDELEVRRELKRASDDNALEFALKNKITIIELQNAIIGNDPPNSKMLNAIGFLRVTRYVRQDR